MRYLPLSDHDRAAMLATIGAGSIDDLFVDVPEAARLSAKIDALPDHASELAVERQLSRMARRNLAAGDVPFFLGAGAYRHHIPASEKFSDNDKLHKHNSKYFEFRNTILNK